jgi:hypothetical protein
MKYNRFGAAYTEVVAYFSGAVVGDFGDQAAVEAIMDFIETDIVAVMNPAIRRALKRVDGMIICESATDGQTVISVPTDGGLKYDPTSGYEVFVNYQLTGSPPLQPRPGSGYTHGTEITVTDVSDVITITLGAAYALSENDIVIMSCEIDPTDTDYEVETLKQILLVGSAAMIAPKAYSEQDDNPMAKYEKKYQEWKAKLAVASRNLRLIPEFSARNQVTSWNMAKNLLAGKILR